MHILQSSIGRLRVIAHVEGWSYLILLFLAMPLKYFADIPEAVSVTGMIHGTLFILFCLALAEVFLIRRKLTFLQSVAAFISSLIPFGTFVLDAKLLRGRDMAS